MARRCHRCCIDLKRFCALCSHTFQKKKNKLQRDATLAHSSCSWYWYRVSIWWMRRVHLVSFHMFSQAYALWKEFVWNFSLSSIAATECISKKYGLDCIVCVCASVCVSALDYWNARKISKNRVFWGTLSVVWPNTNKSLENCVVIACLSQNNAPHNIIS